MLLAAAIPAVFVLRAAAQPLTQRSMMVTSSNPSDDMTAPDGSSYSDLNPGDPRNGAKVGHTYTFTINSSTDAKAMTFQYCDSPFGYKDACIVPDGFSAAAWDGGEAVVEVNDGTTTDSENWAVTSTGGFLTLSNGSSTLDFEPSYVVTVTFTATNDDYFVNPSSDYLNQTNGISSPQKASYFAHIRTHNTASPAPTNDNSLTTSTIDDGTVASSVTTSIGIYTRVQETLNFSVEGHDPTVDPPGPTPQNGAACDPLTRQGAIKMGDTNHALSTQQAYFGKSYFRLSTNSANGTAVFYAGSTLSSGNHDIEAIGADDRELSNPGNEQFGLAFDLTENATANVGHDGDLIPLPVYNNNANGYAFDASNPTTPKKLAESSDTVTCDTGSIQYIANIAPDTPAGIYQTKINYIASPTY